MGYQIEIAFNMKVVGSVTDAYSKFVKKAEKNNCEMNYITYEREGYRGTVKRNHSIMTFIFPDDKKYIINFIRFVREFKEARFESISTDDIKPIILLASSQYLSTMDLSSSDFNQLINKSFRRSDLLRIKCHIKGTPSFGKTTESLESILKYFEQRL